MLAIPRHEIVPFRAAGEARRDPGACRFDFIGRWLRGGHSVRPSLTIGRPRSAGAGGAQLAVGGGVGRPSARGAGDRPRFRAGPIASAGWLRRDRDPRRAARRLAGVFGESQAGRTCRRWRGRAEERGEAADRIRGDICAASLATSAARRRSPGFRGGPGRRYPFQPSTRRATGSGMASVLEVCRRCDRATGHEVVGAADAGRECLRVHRPLPKRAWKRKNRRMRR